MAVHIAFLVSLPSLLHADGFAGISDLNLMQKAREAVAARDESLALDALTEMQRRQLSIFAAEETSCEEAMDLPLGITDWKFRAVARQAYFRVAMSRRLAEDSCKCLFDGFSFDDFTVETLAKLASELTDEDRTALEGIRDQDRRETEARFRDLEQSCRVR
ncbi:MAG: hypothetical protein DI533_17135 [Cereibacter sphaeroides]|uniref:Uncharacterized protein n=1 Tax=Cereibacter sphaeroides TaxID=1063 RepID=A0A2W5UDT0_CERSP|nr:MAG: hypothetical protein DI533_17135 [Cereibacter sphaeroides]